MAEMIPETIAQDENATAGEKRLFKTLRAALLPDEEHIVWYEPRIQKRYPDFIIWSQDYGFLVIEVKDWSADQIISINPDHFQVNFGSNEELRESPYKQARSSMYNLMDLLKKSKSFRHQDGRLKDKLVFPINFFVAWSNISQKRGQQIGLDQITDGLNTLYKDEIRVDKDDPETLGLFRRAISKKRNIKFDFDQLTHNKLKELRYIIFPDIRITHTDEAKEQIEQNAAEAIKILDLQQEKTAKSIGAGHRILKGVAGSGKSLVLACRARYLLEINRDWKILIVCYNITLRRYLQDLVNSSGMERDSKIDIFHYHGLVKELTNRNISKRRDEEGDEWDERVGEILIGEIASGSTKGEQYDAILVDEGQDFTTTWVKSIVKLLNKNTDSFLFSYDPAQNVFGRKNITWKSAGLSVQGKRPVTLETSYRNSRQILDLASVFADEPQEIENDKAHEIEVPIKPRATERSGELPEYVELDTESKISDLIIRNIDDILSNKKYSPPYQYKDIGIIYTGLGKSFARDLINKFEDSFDSKKIYWATENQESKKNLDLSSNTVKVLTLESSKGIEFRKVFLVGLDHLPRDDRDEKNERRLTYVGLTRAQESVTILTTGPEGFASEIKEFIEK